mgnify:CR=1 FL=1
MSRVVSIQTNFSVGEMDPLLRARIDLKQYYSALETAKNVVIQPQGGCKRREGLRYITTLDSGAATAVRLIPFEFNTDDSYMFAITPGKLYVFRSGALITDINGSGNNYLAISEITAAMLPELRYAQSADTIIFVHKDLVPLKLVRGATNADWTKTTITFDFTPQYPYTINYNSPTFTITPSATVGNITVTASSVTSDNGTAQAGSTSTITLKTATSFISDDQCNGMSLHLTSGTGSGQHRHISDYNATTKVATVSPAFTTAPDATTGYEIKAFGANSVGQYINVTNGFGRARIIEFVSNTVVKATVDISFFDTDAITSGNWEIEYGYEDAWSNDRGWPKSITFHEGRLWLAGSGSLPSTVWASRVNDFFNFDKGESLDDAALEATLSTSTLNSVTDIFSGRDLQIFTTGGEFYVPQANLDPVTPSNFIVKIATRNGSRSDVPIVGVDSGTLFIQRKGKSLNELAFTDTELAYNTSNVSMLSGHLFKSPKDMAIRRATSTDESDRLMIVNGDDGSMIVFSLLRSQEVTAPAEFTTDGEFVSVGVDVDTIYVVVKRTVNSVVYHFVEYFDSVLHLDSAVQASGAVGSASAAHLDTATVKVILDGIVQPDETVSSNTVTFDRNSVTGYEIGLSYDVEIKTLPVEPQLQSGSLRGFKKRILEVNAEVFSTQAMTVNGEQVAFRQFGENNLDTAVSPYTGVKTVGPLLGFSKEGQITITQSVPLAMTLLALDYKVSVGQ